MFNKIMTIAEFLGDAEPQIQQTPSIFDYNNWQVVKSMDSFKQSVTDLNNNAKEFFDMMKTIHYYFANPILIWNGFISISFWVCLIVCLSSFLIYLMNGRKNDLDRSKFCFALWILLKILDMSIKRV